LHQQDLLTGWLILRGEQVEELVVNSGRLGVFAQIQDKNGPIRWFQRQSNEMLRLRPICKDVSRKLNAGSEPFAHHTSSAWKKHQQK